MLDILQHALHNHHGEWTFLLAAGTAIVPLRLYVASMIARFRRQPPTPEEP